MNESSNGCAQLTKFLVWLTHTPLKSNKFVQHPGIDITRVDIRYRGCSSLYDYRANVEIVVPKFVLADCKWYQGYLSRVTTYQIYPSRVHTSKTCWVDVLVFLHGYVKKEHNYENVPVRNHRPCLHEILP